MTTLSRSVRNQFKTLIAVFIFGLMHSPLARAKAPFDVAQVRCGTNGQTVNEQYFQSFSGNYQEKSFYRYPPTMELRYLGNGMFLIRTNRGSGSSPYQCRAGSNVCHHLDPNPRCDYAQLQLCGDGTVVTLHNCFGNGAVAYEYQRTSPDQTNGF